MTTLPASFTAQMRALLGADFEAFLTALNAPPPVSIRANTRKNAQNHAWWSQAEKIPWHPQGFYLPERPVFTLDPLLHAGAYYVQEASSMLIYEAARQFTDLSQPLKVLDLCAAPGGKSTLLADAMVHPDSLLVANEVIRQRVNILKENIERWGQPNVAVTSMDSEHWGQLPDFFDIILIDAPCSGEGMFRKDPDAIGEWSPAHVELCSARQQRIVASAIEALKPGGILLYSTCTYNNAENDQNVEWLVKTQEITSKMPDFPLEWGITKTQYGHACYPHKVRGEGFYISVLQKGETGTQKPSIPAQFQALKPVPKAQLPLVTSWVEQPDHYRFFTTTYNEVLALPVRLETAYLQLDKVLKTKWFGVSVGEIKGKDLIPSHALALSQACASSTQTLAVDKEKALRFLKKETFEPDASVANGWTRVQYNHCALGWVKILPNRLNNYLPSERRIRMDI